ncbi:MAG: hypothetical protein IKN81_09370 [Oscillospiraceae bacterium]|nr:hypothetical protein [Oscillospiraceae bacterium]
MAKNAELLATAGDASASRDYLLAYQKAVLFTLYQDGLLEQNQLEQSIKKLEQQFRTST